MVLYISKIKIKTMDFIFVAQAVVTFLSFTFLYRYLVLRPKKHKIDVTKSAPEAAGGWPIIGHLPQLSGGEPLYRKLADLADEYGPVYTLRLGVNRTVVVSSLETAKECFTANDKVLAGRPPHAAGKYLGYNYAMFVLSPYGHYWREMRKIATLKLLSSPQLELLKEVRCNEIDLHVKELYDLWAMNNGQQVKVDIKQWFEDLTSNYVLMCIAGKRYYGKSVGEESSARRFREVVNRLFYLAGIPVVSDVIPWLEWLDLGGKIKEMKRTIKELDTLISTWLEEHRQRRKDGQVFDTDFIDVMLSTLEESGSIGDYDPDTVAKATCLVISCPLFFTIG